MGWPGNALFDIRPPAARDYTYSCVISVENVFGRQRGVGVKKGSGRGGFSLTKRSPVPTLRPSCVAGHHAGGFRLTDSARGRPIGLLLRQLDGGRGGARISIRSCTRAAGPRRW